MASTEGCSLALSFMEDARPAVDPAELVEAYSTLLFRIAHSVLRSRTEAEDVVQDVFIRVLEHRLTLSTVRDMRVWLVRIAWNLALDRRDEDGQSNWTRTSRNRWRAGRYPQMRRWRRLSALKPPCARSSDYRRRNGMFCCSVPSKS